MAFEIDVDLAEPKLSTVLSEIKEKMEIDAHVEQRDGKTIMCFHVASRDMRNKVFALFESLVTGQPLRTVPVKPQVLFARPEDYVPSPILDNKEVIFDPID